MRLSPEKLQCSGIPLTGTGQAQQQKPESIHSHCYCAPYDQPECLHLTIFNDFRAATVYLAYTNQLIQASHPKSQGFEEPQIIVYRHKVRRSPRYTLYCYLMIPTEHYSWRLIKNVTFFSLLFCNSLELQKQLLQFSIYIKKLNAKWVRLECKCYGEKVIFKMHQWLPHSGTLINV